MTGGDSRLRIDSGGAGQINGARAIDAHSTKAGDFTEPRIVDKEAVFLTKEGAAAYDALKSDGSAITVEQDPTGIMKWLKADLLRDKQEFSGKTK